MEYLLTRRRKITSAMQKGLCLLLCGLWLLIPGGCGTSPAPTQSAAPPTPEQTAPPAETPVPTKSPVPAETETPAVTPNPTPVVNIVREVVYSEDFESGTSDFHARGSETVAVTDTQAYEGSYSLAATNRTQTWNGPEIDLSGMMTAGKTYEISARVKYEGGDKAPNALIYAKYTLNGSSYLNFGSVRASYGEWIELKGSCEIGNDATSVAPYFETDYSAAAADGYEIYIDNVTITCVTVETTPMELPSIHEAYSDRFSIGVAIGANELSYPNRVELIKTHFNSMTMGNEMKPDAILDITTCASDPEKYYTEPALHFDNLDKGMIFAQENGIPMRGHTLLWHSQTPKAFFTENYTTTGTLVSAEVMAKRLESYIKQVLEYCQETYPGVIYAWDVVNEAIFPNDNTEGNIRKTDSRWYEVMGESYVELAFTYARRYADPDVKLFYNDFNCYETLKCNAIYNLCKDLFDKGLLDGIGMQSHIGIGNPTVMDYQSALEKLGSIGCEIQVTELDVNYENNTETGRMNLASRYKRFMGMLSFVNQNGGANITNVTLWGLTDDYSWLNKDDERYPLLFDKYLNPKPSFWGFLQDPAISLT